MLNIDVLYSLSGLLVGLLVGITGVGGGSLMTPLLILLFGIHPQTAVGTDLLYAAATKTAGTSVHGFARSIEWRLVGRLAAGSVPASLLTISTLSELAPADPRISALITTVLGAALALTAIAVAFRDWIVGGLRFHVGTIIAGKETAFTVLTGAVLGVLVSMTSVGAGALGVTALLLIYPRLPMVRIVGSDIAHAVPLTLIAGMGHWAVGNVDWTLLGSLLLGSIPGIVLGSVFATRAPEPVIRMTLAGVLTIVSARLLFN